jgi:hypothetical protein
MALPTLKLDEDESKWQGRLVDAGFAVRDLTEESSQVNRIRQRIYSVAKGDRSIQVLLWQKDDDRSPSLTLMTHLPGCSAEFVRDVIAIIQGQESG